VLWYFFFVYVYYV